MQDELRAAWEEGLERAGAFEAGDDPEPVLEALGLVLVLDLTGDLAALGGDARALLRDRGRRALLAGAPANVDPDDWQLARDVARSGLALLEGRAPRASGTGLHPTDGRLVRMLRGAPDGLSAGSAAGHVRRCGRCRAAVGVLDRARGPALPPLAVAAASGAPMRSPAEGRLMSQLRDPEAEVLLFHEEGARLLAVYAADPAPVRVVGEGLTTEQMLAGYWLGRLDDSVARLRATLHVGDRTAELDLDLTAG